MVADGTSAITRESRESASASLSSGGSPSTSAPARLARAVARPSARRSLPVAGSTGAPTASAVTDQNPSTAALRLCHHPCHGDALAHGQLHPVLATEQGQERPGRLRHTGQPLLRRSGHAAGPEDQQLAAQVHPPTSGGADVREPVDAPPVRQGHRDDVATVERHERHVERPPERPPVCSSSTNQP